MDLPVKKGKKCPTCSRYYDRHVVVDAVIIKNGQVLMMKRNKPQYKGYWALIGGFVNWDETVEEAVKREVKEEVGINIKKLKLNGVYSSPDRDPDGAQNVDISFMAEALDLDFKLDPIEVSELKWFPLNDLPQKVAFDHRKIIADCIATL